jgi:dihydrofolate synthase/folylpolyglutamate synthase
MAAIASLEQAGAYLEGLINSERSPDYRHARLGLGPIQRLLDALGNPERALSVIHVAGSKGKGSTALFAESVLGALGERVGTFTSPHLRSWSERFRLGGCEAGGERIAAAVERVRPFADALRAECPDDAPTFFDATTAAALVLFAEEGVDRAVLEVGLGGRLDSTNAVAPAVSCITSIELEHTEKLGDTLAAIAGEKAGILKAGVPCVAGPLAPEAAEVVVARARALGSPLFRLGEEIALAVDGGAAEGARASLRYAEPDGFAFETTLGVPGEHQARNAALAVAAVRRLGVHPPAALAAAAAAGLAGASLPGRVEVLGRDPWVIVDSAHTAASARALAEVLEQLRVRRTHLVLSISVGKHLAAILEALLPLAAAVTVTRAEPRRSLDPVEVAAAARTARPGVEIRVVPNPHLAVRAAREALGADEALCVTGSFYLAGIGREVLADASRPGAPPIRVTRRSGPPGAGARG